MRRIAVPLLIRLGLSALAAVAVLFAGTAPAKTTRARHSLMLLGNRAVEPGVDTDSAGSAEAFPFANARAGTVSSITVYVDRGNHAGRLIAGLYANNRGRPGRRLTSGSLRSPKRGAWNPLRVRSLAVRAGRTYWLAVLARGGRLSFRDRVTTGCRSVAARRGSLKSLPSPWPDGRRWPTCSISAHADGRLAPGSAPKHGSGPPPPASGGSGSGGTGGTGGNGGNGPGGNGTDCAGAPGGKTPSYTAMDACGFPSPDTTGVPAGTTLTPVESAKLPAGATWSNGELDISGSNVVISGLNIDGNVHITGSHATLEKSYIHGTGDPEVLIYQNATDTLMQNDEVTAPVSTIGAINNANGQPFKLASSYLHDNCTGTLGPGDFDNNYMITDGNVPGCHVEDGYVPGNEGATWAASPWGPAGPAYTRYVHNTLLNPLGQTAAIFLDNHASGPNHNVTVNDNLMGGGGYVTYGDSNGDGSTNIVITNNRFTRLYYRDGGYYGAEAQNDAATTFTGNIWDDTLQTLRPNS